MERKKLLPGSEPLQIDTKAVHQLILQFEKEFSPILLPVAEEAKQTKQPRIYYPHLIVEIPRLPYSDWNIWCHANTTTVTAEMIKKIDRLLRNFSLLQCVGLISAPRERSHEHSIATKSFQQYIAFIRDNGKNPFVDFRVYNIPPELMHLPYRKESEYASCIMLNYWRSEYNRDYCIEKGLSYEHNNDQFMQLIRPSLTTNEWKAFERNRFAFMEKYIRKNLCDKPVDFLLSAKNQKK